MPRCLRVKKEYTFLWEVRDRNNRPVRAYMQRVTSMLRQASW